MKITIIGTGYVGVVSAAAYASLGHQVIGLDIDQKKIDSLKSGKVPFFEPELEDLLTTQQAKKRLSFSTSYADAIPGADVILVAVGTPSAADGQADLTYVFSACTSLAPHLSPKAIVAIKSTVPPGTLNKVRELMSKLTKVEFYTASLPEFLREGSAVQDFLHPDRVVIGATEDFVFDQLTQLHAALKSSIIKVKPESAQMGKYTANAYLAVRITFINQIADLCQKNNADIDEVIQIIGHDQRIGTQYWYPGFGYGGSCFPKDVDELAAYSRSIGEPDNLINKVSSLNKSRIPKLLEMYEKQIGGFSGKTVAVLGLSFKPNTNDMREAPSTKVIPELLAKGASVAAFDPVANDVAPLFIKAHPKLAFHSSIAQAINQADVIISLVEWPEILGYDFAQNKPSKKQWFIDARNQFDQKILTKAGYTYIGVGK